MDGPLAAGGVAGDTWSSLQMKLPVRDPPVAVREPV
jgi:hypothetical protein